ncbi:MAG: 30S ribosomal protein S27ae [Candidatus Poseidoniales archaeon]|jgi:small subunit ribosomal protein S27Ae
MTEGPSPNAKWSKYTIDGDSLVRKGEFCPTCGPGVFLGVHNDRKVCGKCGHSTTE